MAKRKNRYRDLARILTVAVGADTILFVTFLVSAGNGITWLKVTSAIIAIALSVLAIGFLILIGEARRPRSLWLSVSFAAIAFCILISLICNFPSPNPLKDAADALNPGAVGALIFQ